MQSPQLLELSGIGRPELLQRLGIPVRHALQGVGENYIDHFAHADELARAQHVTLNEMSRGWRLALQVAHYFLRRARHPDAGDRARARLRQDARPGWPTPDAQYFFMHASYANAAERILDRAPGMTIGVTQLRPESAGSIHARSADPVDKPAIRPNLLASEVGPAMHGARHADRAAHRRAAGDAATTSMHEMTPGAAGAAATPNGWTSRAATARPSTTPSAPAGWARTTAAVVDPRAAGCTGCTACASWTRR